jgi:O-antigen/teichoic acid export membrane protein
VSLRAHLRKLPTANALFGVAEYVSIPVLMVCSAPFLLHRLGAEQYAIWVLATATVTGGTLLSTGFGDAAVKYVSAARGRRDDARVEQILRTLLSFNLLLGGLIALLVWCAAPFLARHLPHLSESLQGSYRQVLGLAAVLLTVKSVESVFICAQRAYERYGPTTGITIATRAATIGAAVVLAAQSGGVVAIMWATLAIAVVGLGLQMGAVWSDLPVENLLPGWDRAVIAELFGFGCFSWLQGLVALFSSQADRLIVGYMLGAAALSYYSICVQIALPIHGIAAAGLQVLFPYLGARLESTSRAEARKSFVTAFGANAGLVLALALPVALGSRILLRHWIGQDFADHAAVTLTVTACSFALLGLNVTGHYFLMALGRVRLLALVNLAGAVCMFAGIAVLAPRYGVLGAACGRLIYGPITWISYRALYRALREPADAPAQAAGMLRACEDS